MLSFAMQRKCFYRQNIKPDFKNDDIFALLSEQTTVERLTTITNAFMFFSEITLFKI